MSKLFQITKNRKFTIFLLTLFIFLLVYSVSGFFYTLNKSFQDRYYVFKDAYFSKKASKDIIVVEIDEKTLASLGRFPFSRDVYPQVLEHLAKSQVAVIGMDIIFADKTDPKLDELLSQSFKKAGNVVIGHAILDNGQIEPLLPEFEQNVKARGFFPPLIDKKNNTVYSIAPAIFHDNQLIMDHFSLAVLKAYYSYIYEKPVNSYFLRKDDNFTYIGDKAQIPFSRRANRDVLINFIDDKKFTKLSFIDVYDPKTFEVIQKNVDLKDKIILIGTAAKGIKDVFSTPYGIIYGVYIHANMLNTILKKDYLVYFNANLEWVLIFCLIFLAVYFNLSKTSYILILSNIAIVSIFLVILPISIIVFTNVIINFPSQMLFALASSLVVSNIAKYLIENKEKGKLNKALSEYVSEDIAKEVLSGEGKINLDGEKKKIAIFFSDIQGFTTISENFSPETLLPYLREYLRVMSNVIIDEKGFINKYEGDAIMALWGVFGHTQTMELDACNAALLQIKLLGILNKKLEKQQLPQITIRVGIHSGDAIIGNIGSAGRKLEFTALGDNVNLASRLEGVNKFYGTHICVSENIYEKTKQFFEYRYLDMIRVKGKTAAIKIYELVGILGKIPDTQIQTIKSFAFAIQLYEMRKFQDALEIFQKLALQGDAPSEVYKGRCEIFTTTPPPENWQGIWEYTEK